MRRIKAPEDKRMYLARQEVAKVWCQKTTSSKVYDVELAEEFAKILYNYLKEDRFIGG